jgi:hypothetical protein
MMPDNVLVKTPSRVDGHFIEGRVVYALRTLCAWFVMAGSVSVVQAACAPDGQGGVTNSGGTCSVVPPLTASLQRAVAPLLHLVSLSPCRMGLL